MALGEYIFFPCNEGSGTTLTGSGDATVTLDLAAGTAGAAWANSGYVTFDGTAYFAILCSSLSQPAKNILALGDGIIFSWAIINVANQPESILYRVGGGAVGQSGYEVRLASNDRIAGRVRDVSGFSSLSSSNSFSLNTDYFVCAVFNNTTLVKQAYFYRSYNQTLGNVDLSSRGSVPLSEQSNDYFSIGAGVFSGAPQLQVEGKFKNIGFMNLGQKMPVGVDNLVIDLIDNDGVLP